MNESEPGASRTYVDFRTLFARGSSFWPQCDRFLWLLILGTVASGASLVWAPYGPIVAVPDRAFWTLGKFPLLFALVAPLLVVAITAETLASRRWSRREYLIAASLGGWIPAVALVFITLGAGLIFAVPLYLVFVAAGTWGRWRSPWMRAAELLAAVGLPYALMSVLP